MEYMLRLHFYPALKEEEGSPICDWLSATTSSSLITYDIPHGYLNV